MQKSNIVDIHRQAVFMPNRYQVDSFRSRCLHRPWDMVVHFDEGVDIRILRVMVRSRDITHLLDRKDIESLIQAVSSRSGDKRSDYHFDSWHEDQN